MKELRIVFVANQPGFAKERNWQSSVACVPALRG
jgi:hypothetical protein